MDFPLYLVLYNEDGFHPGKKRIPDAAALQHAFAHEVMPAVEKGLEVVITDIDDFAVFHAKDKTIIFPSPDDIEAALKAGQGP